MHHLTVDFLRKSGYKVAVHHHRNLDKNGTFKPKGGKTVLTIDSPSGERFVGTARCSDVDNYSKRIGISIALGRSGVKSRI